MPSDLPAPAIVELRTRTQFEERLHKEQRRREFNLKGYEGKLPMTSVDLAETLRAKLREILDANGKPFDMNVARHVYDFAIAAKDLLVVSAKGVEDTIKVINDQNGPLESLTSPSDPVPVEQVNETFGAKLIREVLAMMPLFMKQQSQGDTKQLVQALAQARMAGMPDVAHELEIKLLGHTLPPSPPATGPQLVGSCEACQNDRGMCAACVVHITRIAAVPWELGSYGHGCADGLAGATCVYTSGSYVDGHAIGQRARRSKLAASPNGSLESGAHP